MEYFGGNIFTIGITLLFLIVGFCGCINEPSTEPTIFEDQDLINEKMEFDVHEWGVFLKGNNCTDAMVVSKAPEWVGVRKPVIYFHSLENATEVEVEIKSITNMTVIPNATIENDTIIWNVTVEDNSILLQNGSEYPYLFYEGEINCSSAIIANINHSDGMTNYYIKNIANYTISNVFFIYASYGGFVSIQDNWLEVVYFGELSSGDEKIVTNSSSERLMNITKVKNFILEALISEGLTESESNELIDYWETFWFSPSNAGIHTRVIYQIPQLIYDRLLPISITPQPENIKRVGIFTITDLPIEFSCN
jgi:hypothetical protein